MNSDLPLIGPFKNSEDEHRFEFFNPILKPIFDTIHKSYSIKLNKTLGNSTKRPDFSCHIDDFPILNTEVKPLRYTQFQKTKDFIKACLCAKKTIDGLIDRRDGPCTSLFLLNMGVYIESFIMDLDVDGVYRVFPFMKSILPIDKPSVMSLSPTLTHLIALQEHVTSLAEDYRSRPKYFTPSKRLNYKRKSPDSPQIKILMQ